MVKLRIIILFTLFCHNSFSQSKKQQIILLKGKIDSLESSSISQGEKNQSLLKQLHDMSKVNSFLVDEIKTKTDSIMLLNSRLLSNQVRYSELKRFKLEDSLRWINEIRLYIDSLNRKKVNSLSKWFLDNMNIIIGDSIFSKAKIINASNYSNILQQNVKNEFSKMLCWPLDKLPSNFITNCGNICVDFGDEDCIRLVFITEKYIIFSYHLTMGSNGSSLIYDLENKTLIPLTQIFVTNIINQDLLDVQKDYYENGHVWEYGTYNIIEEEYVWREKKR